MTKANMIKEIQAEEAALWLALNEYDNQHAPVGVSVDRQIEWDMTDKGHCQHLYAWSAVSGLMETLGIPTDLDRWEHKAASELSSDLFRRRQAAQGIFYDENGNEIKRAC